MDRYSISGFGSGNCGKINTSLRRSLGNGVTKGSIYRYENNVQSPSLETARKLAVVLGTTLDNLAGLEDGVVIRLPNLSEAEEAALREFIRRFIS